MHYLSDFQTAAIFNYQCTTFYFQTSFYFDFRIICNLNICTIFNHHMLIGIICKYNGGIYLCAAMRTFDMGFVH